MRRRGRPSESFLEQALPELEAVYRFALRLSGGDGDMAQDIAQETFVRAFRSWSTFREGTNCRAWLFTICRNVFLRDREARTRRGEHPISRMEAEFDTLPSDPLFAGSPQDPERSALSRITGEMVTAAVHRLPVEFREAVILCDLEDLSYAEAAEIMECPIGTVRSRLHRARRLLQDALRTEEHEP